MRCGGWYFPLPNPSPAAAGEGLSRLPHCQVAKFGARCTQTHPYSPKLVPKTTVNRGEICANRGYTPDCHEGAQPSHTPTAQVVGVQGCETLGASSGGTAGGAPTFCPFRSLHRRVHAPTHCRYRPTTPQWRTGGRAHVGRAILRWWGDALAVQYALHNVDGRLCGNDPGQAKPSRTK